MKIRTKTKKINLIKYIFIKKKLFFLYFFIINHIDVIFQYPSDSNSFNHIFQEIIYKNHSEARAFYLASPKDLN